MTRAEQIYNYPLYSLKRFPTFIRYCKPTAKKIAAKAGEDRSWLCILADMIWCDIRYGAMDSREYILFDLWNKSHDLRKTYFTKRKYFRLIKTFDFDVFSRLIEKQNQYIDYSTFIHRRWMIVDENCSKEELYKFVAKNGIAIAKPSSSDCGRGIEKVYINNTDILDRIHAERYSTKYIIEEVVCNCKELYSLNPKSLNTIRVTYVLDKDSRPYIFSVMLRTGASKNAVVDNWGSGGILMDVALDSGIVDKPGLDESGKEYTIHPITKKQLIGYKIPRYKDMIKFAAEVASVNKKVVYGGLDIAITDESFELIEINFPPANIGYQSFGRGYMDEISKINR